MAKTFKETIASIRAAVLGREVRECIAQGMEYVEQFASTAVDKAAEAVKAAAEALASKNAAASSASAAKTSQTAAAGSASAAKTSETAAAASAKNAKTSESAAASSASAAKTSETNAKTSETNAGTYASDAKNSQTAAAGSASTASSAASTATLEASESASSAASAKSNAAKASASASTAQQAESGAASSASAAKASESKSGEYLQATKDYFEQVRTITLGAQGWYATGDDLKAAVPIGENGWWAVVGTTDSIWVWDSDTGMWRNSMVTVDMSDYYTRTQVDAKLSTKADKTTAGINALINLLTAGTAAPTDNDYIITQWANHEAADTANQNMYVRRPVSALWEYIKGKAESVFAAKNHNHDDRYYTETEMDSKLSAKAESIVLATNANLNNVTTPGIYSCGGGNSIANKPSGLDAIGLIVVHNATGGYYTQILTTSTNANTYRRTCLNGTWSAWTQDKYTDTTYSLPTATASVLGGVKVGSNITNTSGVISLTKANVTSALGYTPPTTNTTYSNMKGAASSAAGTAGLVPAPAAGAQGKFLRGDGTWQTVATSSKLDAWPVGSIYQTTGSTSPASLFGGTWTEIASERVLMGASSSHAAGSTVDAGLPNITGGLRAYTSDGSKVTGAILSSSVTTSYWHTGDSNKNVYDFTYNLNATLSSAVYGKSTTVQPAAYYVHIWRRTA